MILLQLHLRRKLFAAILVTAAFGLSIGVMYILWARFEAPYFYTALGAYVLFLLLALVFIGRKPKDLDDEVERDLEDSARTGEVSPEGGMRAPVAVLDGAPDEIPLQVEKATGMSPAPTSTTGEEEPTAAYQMRGFTLYERATRSGTQLFFAKVKPVGGGQPIPLPEGFQATWDAKKKHPYLEGLPTPEPNLPEEPEEEQFEINKPVAKMPTGVTSSRRATPEPEEAAASRARPCSAFNSPGIMCERPAKGESPYCAQHAKYKPDSMMSGFEARRDTALGAKKPFRAGVGEFVARQDTATGGKKPFRGSVGDFEVRVAKPNARPFRFKAPTVDVQIARPSTHPAPPPRGSRAKPPKPVKVPKPAKPLKSLMDRPFQIRVAKPSVKPLRVTGPGVMQGQVSRPKAPKPLKFRTQENVVVRSTKPFVKPLKLRANENVEVRSTKPTVKPLKMKEQQEPLVRSGPSLADAKPLRTKQTLDVDVSTARGSLVTPPKRARRCMATQRNGTRCSNDARPGATLCKQHKDWTPRIEAVVVRDTRSRSTQGIGDQDRRKKR